jgi:branched-chain amino acid transport system permease protein
MNIFLQLVVNGFIAGGTYALAAIGYSMVYSILRFVNFAHGTIAMIGAYLVYTLTVSVLHLNFALALLVSAVLTALLGVTVEKIAYRPLREAPAIASLTTSTAIFFILEAVALLVWSARVRTYGAPVVEGWRLGPVHITSVQVITIAASLFLMVCLYLLLTRTRRGKTILAVADQPQLAQILGVNTDSVISSVFAIGSVLATVGGSLIGLDSNLAPTMGFLITMKGFTAVVLGGMGSLYGAVVGGFFLGMAENLGVWYLFGADARWKESIAYIILVLVLLLRPKGLFGSAEGKTLL